jgi:hypothetical protein
MPVQKLPIYTLYTHVSKRDIGSIQSSLDRLMQEKKGHR